jgi:hypothetical protein
MSDTIMSLKYSYEKYKTVLWISLLPLCLSDIWQGLKWMSNDLHYNKIKLIINTDLKSKYKILIMSYYNEKFGNCFFELNTVTEKIK